MMARVHEIGVGAETRGFEDDIKRGVIKPVEDAEEALERLGKVSPGRDTAKDLDRLEDKLRDVQRETRDTERAAKDLGDSGSRSFRDLGRQGEEIGGELKQNLGETFSSFRGDLEDLPQIAQDTLGGLAGSGALGGIAGLAATAAGAAGLGLIIGAIDNINAAAEASQERIDSWAGSFSDAGAKVLTASLVQSRMNEILTDTGGKLKEAQTNAENWGVSQEDAVLAMSGHAPTIEKISADLERQGQVFIDLAAKGEGLTTQQQRAFEAYQNGQGAFRQLTDEMAAGASVIDIQSAALINLINASQGATKEVDEVGNAVYRLPDGTEIFIDAQTGLATQNVDKFKGDVDGIPEEVTSTVKVRVDSSAWDNWTPRFKQGWVNPVVGRSGASSPGRELE